MKFSIRNTIPCAFLLILGAAGCEFPEFSPTIENNVEAQLERLDNDYFPMHEGNFWKIEGRALRSIDNRFIEHDQYYFQWQGTFGPYGDQLLTIHRDNSDKIWVDWGNGVKGIEFDLNASVDDIWNWDGTSPFDHTKAFVVLLSKTDTVSIGEYTFTNVYRFRYEDPSPGFCCTGYDTYLAPGIGIIKEDIHEGTSSSLTSFLVNGNHIKLVD